MTILILPRECLFCLHPVREDLVWCGDFWACRNELYCDDRARAKGLHLGEHIEEGRLP